MEKNVASPMHHLKDDNGTLITDRVEIANLIHLVQLLKTVRPPRITLKSSNLSRHKRKSKRSTLKQTEIFVIIRSLRRET